MPYKWALICRNNCYKYALKKMGKNSNICDGVTIDCSHMVSIGERVSIHEYCWFQGYGGITIGDFVGIGSGTKIISGTHNNQRVDIPFKEQGLEKIPVIIEDDVWIGTNVVIIGKAKIGKGSVISAGSVISGNIQAYSVVVGNPGRVVKRR